MLNKEICRPCYRNSIQHTGPETTAIAMDTFEEEWSRGLVWCEADEATLHQRVADAPPPKCPFVTEQAVSQC